MILDNNKFTPRNFLNDKFKAANQKKNKKNLYLCCTWVQSSLIDERGRGGVGGVGRSENVSGHTKHFSNIS